MDEQRGPHSLKELLGNLPNEFRIFEQRAHTEDGYLDDLDHAWALLCAEGAAQSDVDAASAAITGCVCYALIRTSINSVAANYSPATVARAVELGIWPARWALSVAANIPQPGRKIQMYVALVGSGQLDQRDSQTVQQMVLDVVLKRQPVPERMVALGELAPHLSEPVLKSAFDATFALRPEVELKSATDPTLAQRRLEIERSMILTTLAPGMNKAQLLQVLDSVLALEYPPAQGSSQPIQVMLLHRLIGYLSQAQLGRVLEAALVLKDEVEQADMLVRLASHLREAVPRALDATLMLKSYSRQVNLLQALVPHLDQTQLARVFGALPALIHQAGRAWLPAPADRRAREAGWLARLLQALAPHLNETQLARVFNAALALLQEAERATLLVALAPHVYEALPAVLDAVLALKDKTERTSLLVELAGQVKEALPQALDAVLALKDKTERTSLLVELAGQVKEALPQAFEAVLALKNEAHQVRLLVKLAQHQGDILPRAVDAVLALPAGARRNYLTSLVPHLDKHLLAQVLDAVLVLEDSREIAGMLEVAQQLPAPHTTARETRYLEERLEAALNAPDEADRANQLAALAPHLAGPLLERVLTAVLRMRQHRTRVLVALLPRLDGVLVQRVLNQLASEGEDGRAQALITPAPRLTNAQAEHAAAAALAIKDQGLRLRALVALLPLLADPAPLRKTIYQLLFGMVRSLRECERRDLFTLCAVPNLFAPPLFAEGTAAAIERQIREISEKWRWL